MAKHSIERQLQMIDAITEHLLKQGAKSITRRPDGDDECLYRGHDGLSCAIGSQIKDEHYRSTLEGHGVDNPPVLDTLLRSGFIDVTSDEPTVSLLRVAQYIHDKHKVPSWPTRLAALRADVAAGDFQQRHPEDDELIYRSKYL